MLPSRQSQRRSLAFSIPIAIHCRSMRVLVATAQVPFVRGGAEILAEGLRDALSSEGHEAEIVAVPFRWYPAERIPEQMLVCRLLDLSEYSGVRVDRVIALKFPAYLMPHPNKVLWLVHQHRQAYDLYDHPLGDLAHFPDGVPVRDAIRRADNRFIPEAQAVYTIGGNVTHRLKLYNGIDSTPLYHPPHQAERFYGARAEPYLFFPSRLVHAKRQALVLEALAHTRGSVCVRFAGRADRPAYAAELRDLARRLGVESRALWLGAVSEEEKRKLYARALGVVFPPLDEDYGYVTLEAMLAAKPVITCTDSGGPLEFVAHGETGLVAEPDPQSLADALDTVWHDRDRARAWGEAGRRRYENLEISWHTVVRRLVA
jgi:glycosyltransferase involved in cell wall biosynthesis